MSLRDIVDYFMCLVLFCVVAFAIATHHVPTTETTTVVETTVVEHRVNWDYIDHGMIDSLYTLQREILQNASSVDRDDFGRCLHFIYDSEAGIPWSFWNESDLQNAVKRYGKHYEPKVVLANIRSCEAGTNYHVRVNWLNTYK
jgi:hypothetical protein